MYLSTLQQRNLTFVSSFVSMATFLKRLPAGFLAVVLLVAKLFANLETVWEV